jgi:palmitoyltransferase
VIDTQGRFLHGSGPSPAVLSLLMEWNLRLTDLKVRHKASSLNISDPDPDPSIGWPPPDPDRIPRAPRSYDKNGAFLHEMKSSIDVEKFRKRQAEDLIRWDKKGSIRRRQPFHKRYTEDAIRDNDTSTPNLYVSGTGEGEESWRDCEGQRLRDFGLDEEAEFYDDDEVPLAELIGGHKQKP